MTPNAARIRYWIETEYPGIFKFGVYNKRPIRGSDPPRWSQHAGYQATPRYRGNALDIFQRDGATGSNATHLNELAGRLLAMKGTYDEFGWGIYHILWRGRSLTTGNPVAGHNDHIHVDFVGAFANSYPDHPSDGDTLRVRNRGKLTPPRYTNEFVPYPQADAPPPPIDPEEDDVEQVYKDLQTGLKAAGYYDGDIDGIWGPISKAAYEAMCKDAAKAGLSHSHPFTGITEGPQV